MIVGTLRGSLNLLRYCDRTIRFAYGLRIAGPIVIGMSTISPRRFLLFNAIGALLWAPLIAGIRYLFGHAIEWLFVDLKRYETIGLISLLLFLFL